ncbi:MAG: hypothetical protein HKL87_07335 [Acidimicrobiaceae bacterium]|nr:hypothetical protein [Acidimicrobiaceae bacterium]
MTKVDYIRDDRGGWAAVPVDDSTGATEVLQAPQLPSTTTSYRELSDHAGLLRNVVRSIAGDVASLHRNLGHRGLDERAQEFKGLTTRELLDELNRLGFTWRDVARMAKVSVPAVQKWRKGESASGENHKRLMVLKALMTMLEEEHLVADVATWADGPMATGAPITPLDLIAGGREDLAVELAARQSSPEDVLDEFESEWRDRYRSDYRVERSSDGLLSIVVATDSATTQI